MPALNIEEEKKRLSHDSFLQNILKTFSSTDMIPVCLHEESKKYDHFIFSILVPCCNAQNTLKKFHWDMGHDSGSPCTFIYGANKDNPVYFRYGNDEGFEPIVINRNFHDIKPSSIEIIEEFRLFHNLFYEQKTGQFIKIFDDGTETVVAQIHNENVHIRAKELRQFLAIKEMCLSIQFDNREYSDATLEEIEQQESMGDDKTTDTYTYSLRYGKPIFSTDNTQSQSIIMGKRLITPLPKEKSSMWGFDNTETPKRYIDFIIGEDDDGEKITQSSNPKSHYNYLTPVHFRNEVLDRYQNNPTKYSIEPGILRCGSLWSMQIDNYATDKIVAWLGDLGRDLPYEEQLHWRSYNIPPAGQPVSEEYFHSQLMCKFTESKHPIQVFKSAYSKLQEHSMDILGWQILIPLRKDDEHYFSALKLLTCDEQKEFDEQILALTKILIDSINEKQLTLLLHDIPDTKNKTGSIQIIENVLSHKAIDGTTHIKYLRDLQNLRSASSAHRKGKTYQEICKKIGLDTKIKSQVFLELLQKGISFLDFLSNNIKTFKI